MGARLSRNTQKEIILNTYRKALRILTRKEKFRGLVVIGMMLVMAAMESLGVASILPFLAVVGNPELVETQPALRSVYEWLGFQSVSTFLIALGLAAAGMILFTAAFRLMTQYVTNRYVALRRHSIGERLLETYLRQPYVFFLDQHSSEMAKNVLSEVDQLVGGVYSPGMKLVANAFVLLAMVTLLLVVDPVLAVTMAAILGFLYALAYLGVRGILERVGRDRFFANRERYKATSETFAGIKDIKLLGRESAFLAMFHGPSLRQARHQATVATLGAVPKSVIQALAFAGMIALTLVLLAREGGASGPALGQVLPIIGLYAFAGMRMMPAAQHIYSSATHLRFCTETVNLIYADLFEHEALPPLKKRAPDRLAPKREIVLEGLSFSYPNCDEPALKDINMSIPVGSTVGVVGGTGSGKTTLVDVILGLLRPQAGFIRVDDEPVTEENLRHWQQTLGYVRQDIFLADATVAENIALGLPSGEIDHDRVARCAHLAQIHDFIMTELPHHFATLVGERGVRLSGGQRQRIGIARALYHDPSVLVFDEATSALDTATEAAVMEAIEALSRDKTIILIAHRLSTVRACDRIVMLEKGRVAAVGTFDSLLQENAVFRELAHR